MKKKSKHKGVSWHIAAKKWQVRFKKEHLGYYADEVKAAKAYLKRQIAHCQEEMRNLKR